MKVRIKHTNAQSAAILPSEISSEIPDHCPGYLQLHETDAEGEVCGGMLEPAGIWWCARRKL